MAAGLNVCRASQWTGFPSTGFRNNASLFGAITGLPPDGRVNRSICHPSARSAATAAGQSPAAMRTTIDDRFMSELYQSADADRGAGNLACSRLFRRLSGHVPVSAPSKGRLGDAAGARSHAFIILAQDRLRPRDLPVAPA